MFKYFFFSIFFYLGFILSATEYSNILQKVQRLWQKPVENLLSFASIYNFTLGLKMLKV